MDSLENVVELCELSLENISNKDQLYMDSLEKMVELYDLALENISNINDFYEYIKSKIIEMYNILQEMDIIGTLTLSGQTDIGLNDIASIINNYNTNLIKLKEYGIPQTEYEELIIIKYIKSKGTLYDLNNKMTDIGTSYRLYIYKNPEPSKSGDVVYTEYDYGFGDFFLSELKSTSEILSDISDDYINNQLSNIEMFRKILDSKISDIENNEAILKIREKYFTNLVDNINNKLLLKKDINNNNTSSNTIIVNNIIKKDKKSCKNSSKKRSLQKKIDKCLKKLDKISN